MLKVTLVGAISAAALAIAGPACALALVAGAGWQADQIDAAGTPSVGSPITFTVPTGATDIFSLTDGFIPGDSYAVTYKGLSAFTTFTLYPTPFNNRLGDAADFASPWT